MEPLTRLSRMVQEALRCPACRATLRRADGRFQCVNPECGIGFPIVDGIPVLVNEQSSLFSPDDFLSGQDRYDDDARGSALKKGARRLMPTLGKNIKASDNFRRLRELVLERSRWPRILVIGGRILGQGMECLAKDASLELVESDVTFGPRTALVCDAHDLPFEDGFFDGVIVQAVLEHVVDPYRCVEEIHRVLKDRGVVYAGTPFMQQVHDGPYDFTRFTHWGHRRLFRRFEEIESGAAGGPGMALAWSYQHFLLSFTTSRTLRKLIKGFAALTAFGLKYFDYYLIDKPAALDAASGYYFLGAKSQQVLSDRDLVKLYRGAGSL